MTKFRQAQPQDAERCYEIETAAYEGDEAATLEKIRTRIEAYPSGFLILEHQGQIAGFINSGCAHQVEMADEAFKDMIGHNPDAPNVVIMSVVVHPDYQGQGLSTRLMDEFVRRMRDLGKSQIFLMCKERHVDLYSKMGYRYLAPSASKHGGMTWHEMAMPL